MTLPTFIGVGGHKCASTWLSECLREHPDVFMSEPKELAFFSDRYSLGLEWYEQKFDKAEGYASAGEFTSHYLYDPSVPARILEAIGPVKIIAVVRDPVARSISQIKYGIRHTFLPCPEQRHVDLPTIQEMIRLYPPIVDRSFYSPGLERFQAAMGVENVLVVLQQDCLDYPYDVLDKLWAFLDLDKPDSVSRATRLVSPGITPKSFFLERLRTRCFYYLNERAPGLISLSRRLRVGELYRRANRGQDIVVSSEARRFLKQNFQQDWERTLGYCWRPEPASESAARLPGGLEQ